jgi:hypothetical protein
MMIGWIKAESKGVITWAKYLKKMWYKTLLERLRRVVYVERKKE